MPYLSGKWAKKRDFVYDYSKQLEEHIETSLKNWMEIIDNSEETWREGLSSRIYFINYRWLFNDISEKESNATHKIWTLNYIKRNIYLIGYEFDTPTELFKILIEDFTELFETRRWIMSTMKNGISHSYTALSTSLAIAALAVTFMFTDVFKTSKLVWVLVLILLVSLYFATLTIKDSKLICLKQLELSYE